MSVIKCKMCGGELKIVPESSICECEYCGSKQTIPTTDDEKRLKLYERANKLRFENEFDKAAGIYESIVAEYQSEAEAYWGLVLCKYGIEYVDDHKTGKKIPTCHRSSFDSVFDDANFELVMENSDTVSRGVYREEAKKIEELRKGIIEVSSKEEPYDIFICYKETAEDGQRTVDSVIAQDVYDELTEKGYRVFFSRISLEDKLGQEYEPYIFAALNSAKVMLAFGTSYEYYNAVWVKNEWSRFLQLMEEGQKKTLIPCYKDIDAYDMPKEFVRLQAQDMGKVGATQDLLRGIDKIFGRDKNKIDITEVLKNAGDGNALIKRGYFSLEDGEWDKAINYLDQAMDSEPENAEIHLGLFLAKRKLSNLEAFFNKQINDLNRIQKNNKLACKPDEQRINSIIEENYVENYLGKNTIRDLFNYRLTYESKVAGLELTKNIYKDKDWIKAERFASGELENRINNCKNKYLDTLSQKINAENLSDKQNVERIKKEYSDFIDNVEKKVKQLRFQAEASREKDYQSYINGISQADSVVELQTIISGFERIRGYKDSNLRIDECNKKILEIKNEEQRQKNERRERAFSKALKVSILVAVSLLVVAVGMVCWIIYNNKVLEPQREYDEAITLMNDGRYETAIKKLEKLGDYKDSVVKIDEAKNAKETEEKEKAQKEFEEKKKSIINKIDNDDYDGAIEDLSSFEEEEKTQIIDYMVEKLMGEYEKITSTNNLSFISLNKKCLKLIDIVSAEQKTKLIKENDKKCIELDMLITGLHMDYYSCIIDKEKSKSDYDSYNKYKAVWWNAVCNSYDKEDENNDIIELAGDEELYYSLNNHYLYINVFINGQKETLYIITGGSENIIVGETTDKGIYRIKNNGDVEVLEEPIEQDAETFFLDYFDE